jgi:hypothetical protein
MILRQERFGSQGFHPNFILRGVEKTDSKTQTSFAPSPTGKRMPEMVEISGVGWDSLGKDREVFREKFNY